MPQDTKDVQKSIEALSLSVKPDASKSKGGVDPSGHVSTPRQVAESWDEDLSSSEGEDMETEDLATAEHAADFPQAPPPTPVSPRMPRGGPQQGGGEGGGGNDLWTTRWPEDMPSPSKSNTTAASQSSSLSHRPKRSSLPRTLSQSAQPPSSPSPHLPSSSLSAATATASASSTSPSTAPAASAAASSSSSSSASATKTRPEKTDAVARRMIAGALGVRPPKKTDDEREYERATREKELKRRQRERDAVEAARREVERAKAAVWED